MSRRDPLGPSAAVVAALVLACSSSDAPSFHIDGPPVGHWEPISNPGAQLAQIGVRGAYTGVDWFGWGGAGSSQCAPDPFCAIGAMFHPSLGTWQPVATTGAPSRRNHHAVVALPGGLFVWGGFYVNQGAGPAVVTYGDGAIYSPSSDSWSPIASQGAPSPRTSPFAFATETEVFVWGGAQTRPNGDWRLAAVWDGAAYNVATGSWRPLDRSGAPSARLGAAIVATGTDMLVWGGGDDANNPLRDGGVYHLATNTWDPMETAGAPTARWDAVSLWTGSEMLVFGGMGCTGRDSSGAYSVCNDSGFAYDPAKRRWRTIAAGLAPRSGPIAVWTGSYAFIWGGVGSCCDGADCTCSDGGLYDPVADVWRAVPPGGSPLGAGTGYWIGDSVLVISDLGPPGRYFPPK